MSEVLARYDALVAAGELRRDSDQAAAAHRLDLLAGELEQGPRKGGMEITHAGTTCMVVSPSSPLGRQLLGRMLGDSVQLPGRGGPIIHRVVEIS